MTPAVIVGLVLGISLLSWGIGLVRLARLGFRFVTGRPMDGRPRTNATWRIPADRAITNTGRASHWAHLPGWQRAAVRVTLLAAAALAVLALATGNAWALAGFWALIGSTALAATYKAVRTVLVSRHRRRYVRPLAKALGPIVGYPPHMAPGKWLQVPLWPGRDGAETRVILPESFAGGADVQRQITGIVRDKLGLGEVDSTFSHVGRPAATFRPMPRPPKRVTLEDARDLVESAPTSAPLIGIGHRGDPISVDLDSESPHVLISASTGGGKSVTARAILAQVLHHGGQALVLDIKMISHAWARGLPNVRYVRNIADIHDALCALRPELDRRNALVDDGADQDGNTDHVDVGPRLVVLLEEINGTSQRLAAYWAEIRDKEDPKRSPAVDALADALYMGRAVRIHVLALGQMLTARALGGPELRECFGTRILARYTVNAWRMLLPEVWPMPRSSRHPGRVQVGMAGTAREAQVVFLSASEARELSLSGTVSDWADSPANPAIQMAYTQREQMGYNPGLHLVTDDQGAPPVGLSEAVERGIVSLSLEALRSARKQDSEFPPAVGKRGTQLTYDPLALERWERNRPRAGKVSEG